MVVYTVIPTSTNGCIGDVFTVAVTVNPHPVATNVVKTICSRDGVVVALQTAVTNGVISTFSWSTTNNPNVSGESIVAVGTGTITDTLTNVTASPQVVVYTVIPTSTNGCIGGAFTVAVTIRPLPVANAGVDVAVCSNSVVQIGGSPTASGGSGGGYSFAWSPATGLSSTSVANPNASPTTNTTYTVVVTDGNGCVSLPDSVTVTVNAIPATPVSLGNQIVCYGDTNVPGLRVSVGANETANWFTNASGGTAIATGTTNLVLTQTNVIGTYNYYAEASNTITGCISAGRTTVSLSVVGCPTISLLTSTNVLVQWYGSLSLLGATNLNPPVAWLILTNSNSSRTNRWTNSIIPPPTNTFFLLTNTP